MKPWTPEEEKFVRENYGKLTFAEMAKELGRTVPSIIGRITKLGIRKKRPPRWTKEDIQFLRENWRRLSIWQLAKRLNRTETAILLKAKRLKLGPKTNPGKFNKHEISNLLKIDHHKVGRWVKKGWLRATIAKTGRKHGKQKGILEVDPEELFEFLRDYQNEWDARKVDVRKLLRAIADKEYEAEKQKLFQKEGRQERKIPEELRPAFARFVAKAAWDARERMRRNRERRFGWLYEKQKKDISREYPREFLPWSEEDDAKLRELFKRGYTYKEIGEQLGRSEDAVGHRLKRIDVWGGKIAI